MATAAAGGNERLGDILVRDGLITKEQLNAALAEQKSSGHRLGYVLVKLGIVQELEVTKVLAKQYRMPAVDLSRFEVDPKIIKLVPADMAVKQTVLPLKREGRTLTVAMADPTNNALIDDLKFITRYDLFPVIAGEYTLRTLIEKHYNTSDQQIADLLKEMEGGDDDIEVVEEQEEEQASQAQIDDAPVVKLINTILTEAVKRGASDIHVEPFEHEIRVRYRVDGALMEIMKPPVKMKAALTSRVKILSQLNIAERRIPQDGRLRLKMSTKVIDFRVSTVPVLFGEKIVMRILDKGNLTLDLAKFGFEPKAEKDLMANILNPYGMVLVTGPTGSGKTTTLYSALSRVNTVEVNIIMIGEIRDLETGGIAIKAALTGHLVLSTLHTNDAPSTITRMIDMGIEAFNVSSAVNLVVAQRLVRRICSGCKAPHQYSEEELAPIKTSPNWVEGTTTMKGAGCDKCNGTGYKGRAGIYEVMALSPELRRLILRGGSVAELRDQAVEDGMLTLRMDGIVKIQKGVTTLEEVVKETAG